MTDPSELPVSLDKDGSSRLAVRLAAPPIDGAANAALIEFLATRLDVPKSSIRIVSGEASRMKIARIDGTTEATLRRLL